MQMQIVIICVIRMAFQPLPERCFLLRFDKTAGLFPALEAFTFTPSAVLLVSLLALPALTLAAEKKDVYLINPNDHIKNILEKEMDLPVKLRLKSGAEIGGTVARVGVNVVQIAEISGMEFYDAVIGTGDISAVLFKVRKR